MILVDANLLVYAHSTAYEQHAVSREWLDGRLNGEARVGLPWPTLLAFVRIVSNPRIMGRPRTMAQAWAQVESWLSSPRVWIPDTTERHREILGELLRSPGLSSKHVTDAHLAALALEHGLVLCSADTDFARFRGLRLIDQRSPGATERIIVRGSSGAPGRRR